jgi:hypothetical protein
MIERPFMRIIVNCEKKSQQTNPLQIFSIMYRTDRNNYHLKPKFSNIQTPLEVSQFIFELLRDKIPKNSIIFDPCCGTGNLLQP